MLDFTGVRIYCRPVRYAILSFSLLFGLACGESTVPKDAGGRLADTSAEPMPDGGSMTSPDAALRDARPADDATVFLDATAEEEDAGFAQDSTVELDAGFAQDSTVELDASFAQDAQVGQDAGFPSANRLWSQIGGDIDGENTNDKSGSSVSFSADGSVLAVGAIENDGGGSGAGHVRIYQNVSGSWMQIGQDIDGETAGDKSGYSVSLNADGSIVAIGAIYNDGNGGFENGHVRVYQNAAGTWTQIGQDIDGENGLDQFGNSVALNADGSIVAIGARYNDDNGGNAGHVRIYQNIGANWTQIGQDIDGEASGDELGSSVSLSDDGSIVAIGAQYNDGNGSNSGHARVYQNLAGTWTQIGQDIDGDASNDQFGHSVSLSSNGSIVAIGAIGNDGAGLDAGHVRIYQNVAGTWTQVGQDIDGEAAENKFGDSVSLSADGSIVGIGAVYNYDNGIEAGHVRIYQNVAGAWTQTGQDIDGEAMNDQSGGAVSLSSDGLNIAIGARLNDGNGNNSGHVRVYRFLNTPN